MLVIEDTKLDMTRRNRDLCHKFTKIAAQAAHTEELFIFVDVALGTLEHQLEEKMRCLSINIAVGNEASPVSTFVQQASDNLPRLKKKNGTRGSKRKPSRVETVRKKIQKKITRGSKITEKEIGEHNLNPTATNNSQLEHCMSYAQLLLGSSSFALPTPYFESLHTSQDHTAHHQEEMPPAS